MPPLLQHFFEALGSSLLVPVSEPALFFAMRGFGGYELWIPAVASVAGATAGHGVNYVLGRLLEVLRGREVFLLRDEVYAKARAFFHWYFLPVLLISWYGIGGIPVIVAGFLGVRWWVALGIVALGQMGYYGYWVVTPSP